MLSIFLIYDCGETETESLQNPLMQFLYKESFFFTSTSLLQWENNNHILWALIHTIPMISVGPFIFFLTALREMTARVHLTAPLRLDHYEPVFQFSNMLETNMNILLLLCMGRAPKKNGGVG